MPGRMIFLLLAYSTPLAAAESSMHTCTAIAPPRKVALPHVTIGGDRGKAVVKAIGALLAAQQPAIAAGKQHYSMQELSCRNIATPSARGFSCSFNVSIDGHEAVAVTTPTPSEFAENLSNALIDAGADDCNDFAHGDFLRLSNVVIKIPAGRVAFDDGSNYGLPSTPNVSAGGAAGAAVLHAMEAAGINDCEPSRTVFIVCNKFAETPLCSRTFFPLENIGGSYLANICVPTPAVGPTVQLSASGALAVWNAIIDAAAVSGFKPSNGTLAQTTIINAKEFRWDGKSVAFSLFADNPQPPPPPSDPRADPGL